MHARARTFARRFPALLLAPVLFGCASPGGGLPDADDVKGWVDRILVAEDARDASDPILASALAQDDPRIRFAAYRALARIGDPESLPLLAEALARETVPRLRREAVFAAGCTRHPAVVDFVERFLLVADLAGDAEAHAALLRALGMSGDERARFALLDGIDDPSPLVRFEAALALADLFRAHDDPLGGRPLGPYRRLAHRLLTDPSARVRWACAHAAGLLVREEFRSSFVRALEDADPIVRAMAAEALSRLPPEESSRTVLVAALGDGDFRVAVEAARALASDPDPSVVEPLLERLGPAPLEAHPSHHVRAVCAAALGTARPGAASVLDRLEAALSSDPSASVRGEALEAFVRLAAASGRPDRARDLLSAAIEGRTRAPRDAALLVRCARAAVLLDENEAFALIERLIGDEGLPAVARAEAVRSLGRLRSRRDRIEALLEAALAATDVALVEAAADAAGALALSRLGPRLLAAFDRMQGPDGVEARLRIAESLAQVGDESTARALARRLDDPEPAVRRALREAIVRLGGFVPTLPPLPPPPPPVTPRYGDDFTFEGARPRVELVTNKGPVTLELWVDEAPHHALAFLDRCRRGFYDGLTFHRLVPGFVVQGLDPRGDGYGTGGPTLRSEIHPRRFGRGSVGAPDAGFDTGGCQIFVTFRPQPRLDARYTLFAQVVDGVDVVERLDVGDRVDYVIVPETEREDGAP